MAGASAQVDELAAQLLGAVDKAAKKLSFEIQANLIEATPVDTGWARANWIQSVGEPVTEPDGAPVPSGTKTTAGALQAAGQAATLAWTTAQGELWIANPVPYIARLDLGSSTQAPAGFVESAISVAIATVGAKFAGSLQLSDVAGMDLFGAGELGAGNVASAYSPFGGDE